MITLWAKACPASAIDRPAVAARPHSGPAVVRAAMFVSFAELTAKRTPATAVEFPRGVGRYLAERFRFGKFLPENRTFDTRLNRVVSRRA
jgi:hypothetical protein